MRRRAYRLRKFESVSKCLRVLLDPKLLNFAVYGESFARIVPNTLLHLSNGRRNPSAVKDALSRASEMVEIYVKDRKELREKIREDAAAVQALSEWVPKRLTQWELDFAKVKAGSVARLGYSIDDDEDEDEFVKRITKKELDIKAGIDALTALKSGTSYFDPENEDNPDTRALDVSLERIVDEHLSAKLAEIQPTVESKITDHHLLLAWLDNVFPDI